MICLKHQEFKVNTYTFDFVLDFICFIFMLKFVFILFGDHAVFVFLFFVLFLSFQPLQIIVGYISVNIFLCFFILILNY